MGKGSRYWSLSCLRRGLKVETEEEDPGVATGTCLVGCHVFPNEEPLGACEVTRVQDGSIRRTSFWTFSSFEGG